jgi:hypothetical protein
VSPVVDRSIDPAAGVALEVVQLGTAIVGNSETALLADSFVPGHGFYVEKIEHFCEDITANFSYIVLIGSTALTGATVPADITRADATITASVAERKGSKTDAINLTVTSDGSGAAVGAKVRVHIRPYPMGGEL